MVFYIYIPFWFYGFDSIIELFIVMLFIIVGFYSYKTYKVFEKKQYKYLSYIFSLFSLSFLLKIFSNLVFIYPKSEIIHEGIFTVIYTNYHRLGIIDFLSTFFYKFFILSALLLMFFIIIKKEKIENLILDFVFIIIISFVLNNYILFNFIIVFLTFFIYLILLKERKKTIFKIFYLLFSFSFIFYLLSPLNDDFYFLGEIIMFFNALILLVELIKIKRVGNRE